MSSNAVSILLVEDDRIDEKVFLRALTKAQITNPVAVVRDGAEAWERLSGGDASSVLPRPGVMVLDINMPRMNGIELLRRIRQHPELRSLVVFVLTTSNDDQDKLEAYNLNIAGYMLKSEMGSGCAKAVELLKTYWDVVELPEDDTRKQLVL